MSAPQQTKGEALANLLASLASAKSSDANGENDETTKAKLKSIAEQLGALLSETPTGDPNVSGGPVLNEDGEPIMEITERIYDDPNVAAVPASASQSPFPKPSTYSDDASQTGIKDDEWFARRRRKREALLAQLELEEEEEAMGRERKDMPSNAYRKEVATQTAHPITAPKGATPLHDHSLKIVERPPREGASANTSNAPKTKQVSFADDIPREASPSVLPTSERKYDLGDGGHARLRDAKHESLRALKMDVVERTPHPGTAPTETIPSSQVKKLSFTPRKVQIRQTEVDSDDEDQTSSSGSTSNSGQNDDDDDDNYGDDGDGESDDWDEAMFQRELALAYYEQKGMLKQLRQSVQTPPIANYSPDPGSWEQENVPLDASQASSKHRSAISRFKAERTAQYRASNPSSADPFLAGSVRHGKVVDGELVANPDDVSDDEGLNENAKRIMAELIGRRIDDDDGIHVSVTARPLKDGSTLDSTAAVSSPLAATTSTTPRGEHDSPTSHPSSSPAPTGASASPAAPAPTKMSRFKVSSSTQSSASPAAAAKTTTSSPASLSTFSERRPPPINRSTTSNDTSTSAQSLGLPTLAPPSSTSTKTRLGRTPPKASESVPAPLSPEPYLLGTGIGGGAGFTSMILTPEEAVAPASVSQPMKAAAASTSRPMPAMGHTVAEKKTESASVAVPPSPSPAGGSLARSQLQPRGQGKPQKVSRFKAERGLIC